MTDRYLTLKEVAERTGVSRHTVRQWITNGELKAKNFGGHVGNHKPRLRIKESDFEKFERMRDLMAG